MRKRCAGRRLERRQSDRPATRVACLGAAGADRASLSKAKSAPIARSFVWASSRSCSAWGQPTSRPTRPRHCSVWAYSRFCVLMRGYFQALIQMGAACWSEPSMALISPISRSACGKSFRKVRAILIAFFAASRGLASQPPAEPAESRRTSSRPDGEGPRRATQGGAASRHCGPPSSR